MLIRIIEYLNFLFRFNIEGRMSPGFRLELSTSLLVLVEDIFRRIAASNSCSSPCGLSMVRGGGVNISSGIGVLCCSPWKKIWITIDNYPYACWYWLKEIFERCSRYWGKLFTFCSSLVSLLLFRSPSLLLIFTLTSGTEIFGSVDTTDEEPPKEILTVVSVEISFSLLISIPFEDWEDVVADVLDSKAFTKRKNNN